MSKRPAKKRAGAKTSAKAKKPTVRTERRAEPIELPVPKRGPGRPPTTYDPAFCDRVIELGEQGKSRWQIAVALGCSRKSLYAWMKIHPEFAEAMEEAQFPALAWWEDAGQAGLMLKGFNANLYAYQMKNRFREHYSDKVDVKHGIGEPDQQNPEERELTNLDLARRVAFMLHQAVETKRRLEGEQQGGGHADPVAALYPRV